ncbi:hypothetical protein ACJX0J_014537 [Zea mays]
MYMYIYTRNYMILTTTILTSEQEIYVICTLSLINNGANFSFSHFVSLQIDEIVFLLCFMQSIVVSIIIFYFQTHLNMSMWMSKTNKRKRSLSLGIPKLQIISFTQQNKFEIKKAIVVAILGGAAALVAVAAAAATKI